MAITETAPDSILETPIRRAVKSKPGYRFSMIGFALAIAGLVVLHVFWRMYFEVFALSAGLDVTAPVFTTVWWNLLFAQVPIIFGISFIAWTYLIVTRDRNMAAMTPELEFKRLFYFTLWLVAYTAAVLPVSYWTEGDAAWHQSIMRDSAFGPTHIILFYGIIPAYLFFGVGAFIYGTTRCPIFASGISLTLVLAVVGPFLVLPNVGFNEWGHAFWLTEEVFSHPLHWGFVVLGVTALALAGVAAQIALRLRELFPVVFKLEPRRLMD
jgi:methane/ammonia monooxygenase subunit C